MGKKLKKRRFKVGELIEKLTQFPKDAVVVASTIEVEEVVCEEVETPQALPEVSEMLKHPDWPRFRDAFMSETNRGTGRTTAGLIACIATAIQSPNVWIPFVDHHGRNETMDKANKFMNLLHENCEDLHLQYMDVDVRDGLPCLRYNLDELRAKHRRRSN